MHHDAVHQCPYCELRFANVFEETEHLLRDHPDHREVAARLEAHELPHR